MNAASGIGSSSPEYRLIAPLREAGAESRAVILEGTVD